jgi:hypothetical protein
VERVLWTLKWRERGVITRETGLMIMRMNWTMAKPRKSRNTILTAMFTQDIMLSKNTKTTATMKTIE